MYEGYLNQEEIDVLERTNELLQSILCELCLFTSNLNNECILKADQIDNLFKNLHKINSIASDLCGLSKSTKRPQTAGVSKESWWDRRVKKHKEKERTLDQCKAESDELKKQTLKILKDFKTKVIIYLTKE